MNIIQHGIPQEGTYSGQCTLCKAIIECFEEEICLGSCIKCPTPNCGYIIFLKKGKWQIPWVDPTFKRKEFYITPIVPDTEK